MIHSELWRKIENIELETLAVGKSFSDHLVVENGWTSSFAKRAIREYKKFIYLCAVSDRNLVPSDIVEQVWRLHLTDTRHYWGTFCKIIGKQIHHNPVGENNSENDKSIANYKYTKTLYKEEFRRFPKPEIWPASTDPLSLSPKMERVDLGKFLVLQKPTRALWRSVGRFAGVATFPLSIVAYAVNQSSGIGAGEISSLGWLMVAGVAVVIAVFGCLVWRMESNAKVRQEELDAKDDLQEVQPRFA